MYVCVRDHSALRSPKELAKQEEANSQRGHTSVVESFNDVSLQQVWIRIVRRQGVNRITLLWIHEITTLNGCHIVGRSGTIATPTSDKRPNVNSVTELSC